MSQEELLITQTSSTPSSPSSALTQSNYCANLNNECTNNESTNQFDHTISYQKVKDATLKKLTKEGLTIYLINGEPLFKGKSVLCKRIDSSNQHELFSFEKMKKSKSVQLYKKGLTVHLIDGLPRYRGKSVLCKLNQQRSEHHETLFYQKVKKTTHKKLMKNSASIALIHNQPQIRAKYVLCKQRE